MLSEEVQKKMSKIMNVVLSSWIHCCIYGLFSFQLIHIRNSSL